MTKLLLKKGANINAADSQGWTPLMLAVYFDHIEIIKLLISHGADTGLKNIDGKTATTFAMGRPHKEIIIQELAACKPASPAIFITLDCSKN